MKGDAKVNEYLNQILSIELTSINQYFLHARMFKNWGLNALDEKAYKKSIKDMKQADKLIERILFLEGLPNLQRLNRLRIGETTEEMLQCDLDQIEEQLVVLKEAVVYCESVKDYVTRDLLLSIEEYEEEYLDWLETQQQLISQVGIENYLQSMM
ncbi:bacterioferritin [Bacterioplanoides sp. SCSIO 12839]|uniref:bacterioferritin n=1 Tax=unclassified Bacterioplanoides TaxID=2630303 RepID=UPI002102133F|nr:bacterioferritin [Bacterioplanoides sp. SCSIO 12839]UTW49260.1 bacterioferritin [Bacterioplanoides sp. SCSIO 12839]